MASPPRAALQNRYPLAALVEQVRVVGILVQLHQLELTGRLAEPWLGLNRVAVAAVVAHCCLACGSIVSLLLSASCFGLRRRSRPCPCLLRCKRSPMMLGWLVHHTASSSLSLWQSLQRWLWICRHLAGPQTWLCYAASLRCSRAPRLAAVVHFLNCSGHHCQLLAASTSAPCSLGLALPCPLSISISPHARWQNGVAVAADSMMAVLDSAWQR